MTEYFSNKDKILMGIDAYFRDKNIDVFGYCGLSSFEISKGDNCLDLNRDEFFTLYNLMSEIKKVLTNKK